jgi:nitrate reductase NapE
MAEPQSPATDLTEQQQRRREWRMFMFIIVFLFPLLTFALVGAYGFSIWMYQLLMGPPGAG